MSEASKTQSSAGGGKAGFVEHDRRTFALTEIHARPFQGFAAPRVILHYAFTTDAAAAGRDRRDLQAHCTRLGVSCPAAESNHHIVTIGDARLRWETHGEFTTYTWDMAPLVPDRVPSFEELLGAPFTQPGPLIVAMRMDLVQDHREVHELLEGLDPGTTAVSSLREGRAICATDFQLHADGMTRILLVDRNLYPHEAGPVVIRMIELETYRTMTLLGLPEALALQPQIVATEARLREATSKIGMTPGLSENRELLESLTALAAETEASAARSAFRFGATRAYSEIVTSRLGAIRETPLEGYTRLSSFLQRRMAPAVRTCNGVEARQRELSDRLARATELLRTRIEVDLEQQNRSLLTAMNDRARLQMRLQQWVEGLSVAAVSYYIVSLVFYLARGADALGVGVDPYEITAFAIPPVMVGIWLFVRQVRKRFHADVEGGDEAHP